MNRVFPDFEIADLKKFEEDLFLLGCPIQVCTDETAGVLFNLPWQLRLQLTKV